MNTAAKITAVLWAMTLGVVVYMLVMAPALIEPTLVEVYVPEPEPAAITLPPYGGCDEAWQAPKSAGAQWCRDHGVYPVDDSYVARLLRGEIKLNQ